MKTRATRAVVANAIVLALVGCGGANGPAAPAEQPAVLTPAADSRVDTSRPVRSRCAENFAIFDRDRDRRVSLEELADDLHPSTNPDLVFRQRDRDQDGFLIEAEFCVRLGTTSSNRQELRGREPE